MNDTARTLLTGLALGIAAFALFLWAQTVRKAERSGAVARVFSTNAFEETYLFLRTGTNIVQRRSCASCHENIEQLPRATSEMLTGRSSQTRQAWVEAISLNTRCGACHDVPDPRNLPQRSWIEAVAQMARIMEIKAVPKLTGEQRLEVLHYFFAFCRDEQPALPPDPDPAKSPVLFERRIFGNAVAVDSREHPVIGHVQVADLDRDGLRDIIVCDTGKSSVNWIHRVGESWTEQELAKIPFPANAQVLTNRASGRVEIVAACQTVLGPTDDLVGSVVLLAQEEGRGFKPRTILSGIGRVADVEPGDFDGDGDLDFVVAVFGYINQGEVGWLENRGDYVYHPIIKRSGAIHVLPLDLDQDGRLDFVSLFAQEHEQVSAFVNRRRGNFRETVLFKAASPAFGSSGIQLVDLDRDGDMDILYTNGDNMDLNSMIPRPFHGVQWLENQGNLRFDWHDLFRFYGAYCAVPGDVDNDGDLDIVATSMFNDWSDAKRDSVIWLENNGIQRFAPRGIDTRPISLITSALSDLDGDGRLDVIAGGMHAFRPQERLGRITLWKNLGPTNAAPGK